MDAPIMDVPRPEVYGASGLSQGCGVLSRSWGDRDAGIWVLLQGSQCLGNRLPNMMHL